MATNIIEYITQNTNLKQKDIAKKLGVTKGQISKWKKGEYISPNRKADLNKLAGLYSDNTQWLNISSTKSNAQAWFLFIKELSSKRGISIELLGDNFEIFVPPLFVLLSKFGIEIPQKAISVDNPDFEDFNNFVASLLKSYCIVIKWHKRYFSNLSKETEILKIVNLIHSEAVYIASLSIPSKYLKTNGFNRDLFLNHTAKTKKRVKDLIHQLLLLMNSFQVPITEDFFLVINENTDWLSLKLNFDSDEAEITQYLSYADRKKLESKQYETELLEAMHQKLNILLESQVLEAQQKNNL